MNGTTQVKAMAVFIVMIMLMANVVAMTSVWTESDADDDGYVITIMGDDGETTTQYITVEQIYAILSNIDVAAAVEEYEDQLIEIIQALDDVTEEEVKETVELILEMVKEPVVAVETSVSTVISSILTEIQNIVIERMDGILDMSEADFIQALEELNDYLDSELEDIISDGLLTSVEELNDLKEYFEALADYAEDEYYKMVFLAMSSVFEKSRDYVSDLIGDQDFYDSIRECIDAASDPKIVAAEVEAAAAMRNITGVIDGFVVGGGVEQISANVSEKIGDLIMDLEQIRALIVNGEIESFFSYENIRAILMAIMEYDEIDTELNDLVDEMFDEALIYLEDIRAEHPEYSEVIDMAIEELYELKAMIPEIDTSEERAAIWEFLNENETIEELVTSLALYSMAIMDLVSDQYEGNVYFYETYHALEKLVEALNAGVTVDQLEKEFAYIPEAYGIEFEFGIKDVIIEYIDQMIEYLNTLNQIVTDEDNIEAVKLILIDTSLEMHIATGYLDMADYLYGAYDFEYGTGDARLALMDAMAADVSTQEIMQYFYILNAIIFAPFESEDFYLSIYDYIKQYEELYEEALEAIEEYDPTYDQEVIDVLAEAFENPYETTIADVIEALKETGYGIAIQEEIDEIMSHIDMELIESIDFYAILDLISELIPPNEDGEKVDLRAIAEVLIPALEMLGEEIKELTLAEAVDKVNELIGMVIIIMQNLIIQAMMDSMDDSDEMPPITANFLLSENNSNSTTLVRPIDLRTTVIDTYTDDQKKAVLDLRESVNSIIRTAVDSIPEFHVDEEIMEILVNIHNNKDDHQTVKFYLHDLYMLFVDRLTEMGIIDDTFDVDGVWEVIQEYYYEYTDEFIAALETAYENYVKAEYILDMINNYLDYCKKGALYHVVWTTEGGNYINEFTYGSLPEYTGPTPEKAATDKYTYEFIGWSTEPDAKEPLVGTLVVSDMTLYPVFEEKEIPKSVWDNPLLLVIIIIAILAVIGIAAYLFMRKKKKA